MDYKTSLSNRKLRGKGVEFGALQNPLAVDASAAVVLYADRLSKQQALDLFPELAEARERIVEPDIIFDANTDDFVVLKDYEFDFFIANHFIEHLVNPIRFLKGVSDAMKPGSLLFLTVPDKEHTFDRNRELTTNQHLWRDFETKKKTLCNAHIREFLRNKEPVENVHPAVVRYFKEHRLPLSYYNGNRLPINPFTRRRLYEFHRERSIHVHVWNRTTFDDFLKWTNDRLALGFEIRCLDAPNTCHGELIYLLRKRNSE